MAEAATAATSESGCDQGGLAKPAPPWICRRRCALEGQHALVPRPGAHQMGKTLGQLRQLGFGILIGVDPVARG